MSMVTRLPTFSSASCRRSASIAPPIVTSSCDDGGREAHHYHRVARGTARSTWQGQPVPELGRVQPPAYMTGTKSSGGTCGALDAPLKCRRSQTAWSEFSIGDDAGNDRCGSIASFRARGRYDRFTPM